MMEGVIGGIEGIELWVDESVGMTGGKSKEA